MGHPAEQTRTAKQTALQRTVTDALNEIGAESALIGICERADGPLVSQGFRGFTPREVEAILRTLSGPELGFVQSPPSSGEGEAPRTARLRMITPSAKSLLALPLRFKQRLYGVLVIGRKEGAGFAKKERAIVETAGNTVTAALERAGLFDGTVLLSPPMVAAEPAPAPAAPSGAESFSPPSYATPAIQERVVALLTDSASLLPFDRAWITIYDPLASIVEVLGIFGEGKGDHKKDLKAGQRLGLDSSASGWAVRHKKPRVDNDLASTQGRFLDHKHLYRDQFKSALVIPFFVRGQVGGTVTMGSKSAMQYGQADARTIEPLLVKVTELLQQPLAPQPAPAEGGQAAGGPSDLAPAPGIQEPAIRKQERQAAIGEFSAFLATEIREPLASIRAQLEEVTGEGILDFDPQTRVENAMRDLIRVEAILNEILDFAKPLELNRRLCRAPDIIETALTVVATDLEMNRINVAKDYAANLHQVRCDDAKMQQVFLSIFKNSLEAMSPGGHLDIQLTQHRAGRGQELQILIKNDGVPIPSEHVDKVFEPFFTTKRAGTGLGLATVKKIVEEHHGQISIASGPGEGTTTVIRLPTAPPRGGFRRRGGRGRRPPRSR